MKRGRRQAIHADEFSAVVCNRWEFFGYSVAALSKLSGVNRGTLSEFKNGERSGFGYKDRLKLIQAFELGPEAEERFLDDKHRHTLKSSLILLDPPASPHPPLERGQRLLIRGAYEDAVPEFEIVRREAAEKRNYALQADAAARLAWAYFEQCLYTKALECVEAGIRIIESCIGATLAQIMDSIRPGSHSALCPVNEEASHVLSRLLQIQYKVYIESVLYGDDYQRRKKATEAIEQSVALDKHLQLSAAIGHDLRWQAVLEISGFDAQTKIAGRLLSESAEHFKSGSLGAAYLARDRGIVGWQTGRYVNANDALLEAVDSLASFADSRALGPTFHILSRVALQAGADAGVVRRYSLAGAALHPYGFILGEARAHIRKADTRGLRSDIEKLLSGHRPFQVLRPVMSRLSDAASPTVVEQLQSSLSTILGTDTQLWSAIRQQFPV